MKRFAALTIALLALPQAAMADAWCPAPSSSAPDDAPVMNIPAWVCETAASSSLDVKYSVHTHIKPLALAADFNSDGEPDIAIWISDRVTSSRGIAIFLRGEGSPLLPGDSTSSPGTAGDWGMFDAWSLISQDQVLTSHWEEQPLELAAPAIRLSRSESASIAMYWDGISFQSYVLTD